MNTTDRRATLLKEFAETNEQLRLLKVKASKLHAELIALKGVNKKIVPPESQLSNANSVVDSKLEQRSKRWRRCVKETRGRFQKLPRAQTSRKVYDNG